MLLELGWEEEHQWEYETNGMYIKQLKKELAVVKKSKNEDNAKFLIEINVIAIHEIKFAFTDTEQRILDIVF